MTFEEIQQQFREAKTLLLIRAKNAPFIISFFYKVFSDANVTTISNSELRSKLEGYLEELSYEENDDDLESETLFDDFSVRAAQYIDKCSLVIKKKMNKQMNKKKMQNLLEIYSVGYNDIFNKAFDEMMSKNDYKTLTKKDFVDHGYMSLSNRLETKAQQKYKITL